MTSHQFKTPIVVNNIKYKLIIVIISTDYYRIIADISKIFFISNYSADYYHSTKEQT